MFYTEKEKKKIYDVLDYLSDQLTRQQHRIFELEQTSSALLKIATNKAKQDSSVTVPKKGDFS